MPVYFHSEDCHFQLENEDLYINWVKKVVLAEGKLLSALNFIFTSNAYLLKINQEYLNHNYFTDVITFNYNEESKISGDIFVSVDQVKINSIELGSGFISELSRVMIHGVLHLLGYNDASEEERKEMRMKEDEALQILERVGNE